MGWYNENYTQINELFDIACKCEAKRWSDWSFYWIYLFFESELYRNFLLSQSYIQSDVKLLKRLLNQFFVPKTLKEDKQIARKKEIDIEILKIKKKVSAFERLYKTIWPSNKTINLKEAKRTGKIVLVAFNKKKQSEQEMDFIWWLILSNMMKVIFWETELEEKYRRMFNIFVDETPNFLDPILMWYMAQILAEARKYQTSLNCSFQFRSQIRDRGSAWFLKELEANTKTKFFMRSLDDADLEYQKELCAERGNKFYPNSLKKLPEYTCMVHTDGYGDVPMSGGFLFRPHLNKLRKLSTPDEWQQLAVPIIEYSKQNYLNNKEEVDKSKQDTDEQFIETPDLSAYSIPQANHASTKKVDNDEAVSTSGDNQEKSEARQAIEELTNQQFLADEAPEKDEEDPADFDGLNLI